MEIQVQDQGKTYRSTHPLSSELFVAIMIHHITDVRKERVWYGKLVKECAPFMPESTVSQAIDCLEDWIIIAGEYGETENGRASRVWYIDTHDGGDYRIKELHDQYWSKICPKEVL